MSAQSLVGGGVPGLYGKLPARGDFIQRDLPAAFVEPWDEWLQAALAASQDRLGQNWLPSYLTGPIWRFALTAGCCGDVPVAGLLMPSVDRVGRYFPLTMACTLDPAADVTVLLRRFDDWYHRAEQLLLEALADDLELDTFYQRLAAIGVPAGVPVARPSVSGERWCLPLTDLSHLSTRVDELTPLLLAQAFPHYSLWWSHGSPRVDPCLLISAGLPSAGAFSSLLAGDWAGHDWIVVTGTAGSSAMAAEEGGR